MTASEAPPGVVEREHRHAQMFTKWSETRRFWARNTTGFGPGHDIFRYFPLFSLFKFRNNRNKKVVRRTLLGGFEDVDHLFQINGTRQPFRTDSRFKRASASSQKICRLPLPLLQLPHSRTPALPLPLSFPLQPRTRVRVSAAFLSLSLALGSAARLDRENFS